MKNIGTVVVILEKIDNLQDYDFNMQWTLILGVAGNPTIAEAMISERIEELKKQSKGWDAVPSDELGKDSIAGIDIKVNNLLWKEERHQFELHDHEVICS